MEMEQIFENGLRYLIHCYPDRVHELDKKKIEISAFNIESVQAKAFHETVKSLKSGESLATLIARTYGTEYGRIIQTVASKDAEIDPDTLRYHYHVAAYDLYLT